jgi:hypothetical protein
MGRAGIALDRRVKFDYFHRNGEKNGRADLFRLSGLRSLNLDTGVNHHNW